MQIQTLNFNPRFKSTKQDRILCEKMLQNYRKEYPKYFHSNSRIEYLSARHKSDEKYNKISAQLEKLAKKYSAEIERTRAQYKEHYASWDDFIESIDRATTRYKAANCQEQAILLQDIFLKHGKEAHIVSIVLQDKNGNTKEKNATHVFVVTGLKKDAKPQNPDSWGNKAIIVDPWANFIISAKEGLDYYTRAFNYNPKEDTIKFYCEDLINIKRYLSKTWVI